MTAGAGAAKRDVAAGAVAQRAVSDSGSVAASLDARSISEQLPRRRRRLGLSLVGLGVFALALQGVTVWLLPYDSAALDTVRRMIGSPQLTAAALVWSWAVVCWALLGALARAAPHSLVQSLGLAVLCGLALGSAHGAAGGAAASLAVLLLVGMATLGWQASREGGLALLAATAATVAGWDMLLSDFPGLWLAAAVLVGMFVWIDRMHIHDSDQRLFNAVADRDSLIESLDERSAQLTQLQGARTRLLASISHDLRQPLQAVRLFAEALQSRPADDDGAPPRWHELLRQQMRAADDAVAMLDQFSEFSAIEQGALVSHPQLLDLRDLLDGVAANLQATHPSDVLNVTVHGRHQWLHADRPQLTRLVQNLAGNAVRYSLGARPGVRARVVLAVRPRRQRDGGPGLAIDVVDNGRGIPPDKLEEVFLPYVQLAGAGTGASRGGRGLGLAIVRGLVAQLGLQMARVRSTVGRGTRFRVLVPAALRRPAPLALQPEAAAAIVDDSRLDGWLLALLEDEDGPRAAMRAALEGVGATIVDAGSLDLLKQRLDDEPRFPDALVFDLDLGAGQPDGLAAVEELRAEWDLQVPALIVTGRVAAMGTVPIPMRCAVLGKPVPLALLVAALRRFAPGSGAA